MSKEIIKPRAGLYLCTRTSACDEDRPCDEAFRVTIMNTYTEVWAVELGDIQPFVDKYGECVVGRNDDGFATIEIYDAWREGAFAAEALRLREALAEIREVWAGAEVGEPVYAQEAYAVFLCRQMFEIAARAIA